MLLQTFTSKRLLIIMGAILIGSLLIRSCNFPQSTTKEEEKAPTEEKVTETKPEVSATEKQSNYGIDLSKWNGELMSTLNSKDNISFVIIKATEGITYTDPMFESNWKTAMDKNIPLGVYHFYMVTDDPLKQAENFLHVVDQMGSPKLPYVVDIEQASLPKENIPSAQDIQADVMSFLKYVEDKTGSTPMLYTGLAFAEEYLNNDEFARYPLWLAEYTDAKTPQIPKVWEQSGYTIWQKSDHYSINSDQSDLDVYHGELDKLFISK